MRRVRFSGALQAAGSRPASASPSSQSEQRSRGRFQRKARTDPKTGLATADWRHDLAKQALARAQDRNGTLGMLMVDLDHFKDTNDKHDKHGGHLVSDQVLTAVGNALRDETREQDVCGRFGGDELVILIPDVGSPRNLHSVAERIRRRIRAVLVEVPGTGTVDGQDVVEVTNLTVSIGGVVFPDAHVETVDDLLRIANVAVYEAKRGGRDRTCLSPSLDPIPTQPVGS
jgi:diguanylate cyclase (GGDEF)-like protein